MEEVQMKTRKMTVKLCGVMLCVLAVYSVARNVCAKCIMTGQLPQSCRQHYGCGA